MTYADALKGICRKVFGFILIVACCWTKQEKGEEYEMKEMAIWSQSNEARWPIQGRLMKYFIYKDKSMNKAEGILPSRTALMRRRILLQ